MIIDPQTRVYEGMIIGQHTRDNDLIVNIIQGKKLSNVRAAGKDEALTLTPPMRLTLERALSYIQDDELVEITPKSIRLGSAGSIPTSARSASGRARPRRKRSKACLLSPRRRKDRCYLRCIYSNAQSAAGVRTGASRAPRTSQAVRPRSDQGGAGRPGSRPFDLTLTAASAKNALLGPAAGLLRGSAGHCRHLRREHRIRLRRIRFRFWRSAGLAAMPGERTGLRPPAPRSRGGSRAPCISSPGQVLT